MSIRHNQCVVEQCAACVSMYITYFTYLFYSNVELESHPTTVPSDFYEPTDDDTSARNNHDPKKPPDYSDALTYRKPTFPDEGYPEPSLVDEPPPPSYDSIH